MPQQMMLRLLENKIGLTQALLIGVREMTEEAEKEVKRSKKLIDSRGRLNENGQGKRGS